MENYRNLFPMINSGYIYFNSASTSLKPQSVISEMDDYYTKYSVNLSRGVDSLSYNVTQMFEGVRLKVSKFINADYNEIVFNRGTTEGINFVATTMGDLVLNEGDQVIVSIHEHHANFVPWFELCQRKNAELVIVPTNEDGTVDYNVLETYMNDKVKIVALNHVSNVYGGTNDLESIARVVHKYNAYFVVDGAQGIVSNKVDVKKMDVDFYLFSAHKLYGPTGVGVMYGKYEILSKLKPIMFGGEMIDSVSVNKVTYKKPPFCFEAGTMMIAEVLGLGEAIDFSNKINMDLANVYIYNLREYFILQLKEHVLNINIYNESNVNSHLITFNISDIHAHDISSLLDKNKIIVRAGHHCAEPLMNYLGTPSTVRISIGIYNTKEEVDKVIEVLKKAGDYLDVLF